MKHTRKIASLLLALVMVLGLATTAFAAGNDGSITITNATVGKSYSVYKVFDLTFADEAVSYTYTKAGESDALYDALVTEGSPFTLTETTTTNVYAVALKGGKTAADISTFLTANESKLTVTAGPVEATTNEVKFENLPYGYYYITSELGTVVSLDSITPSVNVIDKNQEPGWDPEDPENPDESGEQGKFVASAADGEYAKTSTAAIGDTAYFKINAYAPKYAGDKLVAAYTFTDTLADGFTYNDDLKVTLNGNELTSGYPCEGISGKGGKAAKKREALTDQQVAVLLDTVKGLPPYLFVMLGLYSGLRREEILALQWDCVFLDEPTPYLSVRRAWRTEHNRPVVSTVLKSKAAKRDIPIPKCLVDCLREAKKTSHSDYVIADSNGEPLAASQFQRVWKYVVVRSTKPRNYYKYVNGQSIKYTVTPTLGMTQKNQPKIRYTLDFDVTPHQLRHTYITNLLYAGVDPKTVQYLAGHENSKTTMDIYAKVKYNKPEELFGVVNGAFHQVPAE